MIEPVTEVHKENGANSGPRDTKAAMMYKVSYLYPGAHWHSLGLHFPGKIRKDQNKDKSPGPTEDLRVTERRTRILILDSPGKK